MSLKLLRREHTVIRMVGFNGAPNFLSSSFNELFAMNGASGRKIGLRMMEDFTAGMVNI